MMMHYRRFAIIEMKAQVVLRAKYTNSRSYYLLDN